MIKSSCCNKEHNNKTDYLLWSSIIVLTIAIANHYITLPFLGSFTVLHEFSSTSAELLQKMFLGIVIGVIFLGLLSKVPREFIISFFGRSNTTTGILKATAAGIALDLCSHGILMVGAKLYERGASTGQVMAFLIASPWNSLSLTIILASLIGIPWTITFVLLSACIAIITGYIFMLLEHNRIIKRNPNTPDIQEDFKIWTEAKKRLNSTKITKTLLKEMLFSGINESRMVLRWVFLGVIIASAIRTSLDIHQFQTYFGPSILGLIMTIIAATIIEVCSEGSAPIAADIINRASAPGNGFAFLMTGVSTDYTEIMVLKDTTHSWKVTLLLPLLTLPQIIIISVLLNSL